MAAALGLEAWSDACFVAFAGAGFLAGAFLTGAFLTGAFLTGACSTTNGIGVVAAGSDTLYGAAIEASVPAGAGVSTL